MSPSNDNRWILPDAASDKGIRDQLRKSLQASARRSRTIQFLVNLLLPLLEGGLIGYLTSLYFAPPAPTPPLPNPFVVPSAVLIGLVLLHIGLYVVAPSETPLAQFLVEFDDLQQEVRALAVQAEASDIVSQTYETVIDTAHLSLLAIAQMEQEPKLELKVVFDEVLGPWVLNRSEIFFFREDAYYNIAVYMMDNEAGILKKVSRFVDDRIVTTNRSWKPGVGHVGICYAKEETLFSNDLRTPEVGELLSMDMEKDATYYVALASTPIRVDNQVRGVLVVTSSRSEQFIQSVHTSVVEILANVLGLAVKRCWTGGDIWLETKPNARA